jgi:hypothetical protein
MASRLSTINRPVQSKKNEQTTKISPRINLTTKTSKAKLEQLFMGGNPSNLSFKRKEILPVHIIYQRPMILLGKTPLEIYLKII